jgi:hypothetical protein
VSDTSQGAGWWIASDGKWYPPEQAAGYVPPPPPEPAPPAPEPPAVPTTEPTPIVPPPVSSPPMSPPLMAPLPGPPLAPPPGSAPYGAAPYGAAVAPPATPAKSGNGCLKAFLIVFGILVVIGIAFFVLVGFVFKKGVDTINDKVKAQNKIEQETGIKSSSLNTTNPPQRDISADDMKCTTDSLGNMVAAGTVTNHSSKASVYTVTISFRRNSVEVGTGIDVLPSVSAGEKASWTANSSTPANGSFSCKIYDIERVDVADFTTTTR